MADHETKAEKPEFKHPEIKDLDLTHKLLAIAAAAAGNPGLRATQAAAMTQLAKLDKVMQDELDKQHAEVAKAIAAAEAKAAEDAMLAKRKAEDEAAAKAKEDAAKAGQTKAA